MEEPNPPPSELVNILMVDDRPENLIALTAMLEDPSYQLISARSGREALKRILHDDFAVILLDVMMPDMDGFEVALMVKQRERSRHIPIIFLTAESTDINFIYRGYSLGAVDYLLKPIQPDVVRAKVAVFVDLFRKTEQIRRQGQLLKESERREREHQLSELRRSSEKRYHNLADSIPQIVWTAHPDGAFDYLNERWQDYTGVPPEDARDQRWISVVHPDDVATCLERWHDALASGHDYQVELRLLRARDKTYRWHLCRAEPERRDGHIVAWLGTYTDIDDLKHARTELDRFQATLDAVLDCVWIFDRHSHRFLYVNEGAVAQLGYSREELLQMTPRDVMPEFDEARFGELLGRLRAGEEQITITTVHRRKDGLEHPAEMSLQHIVAGDDGRFVSIARDITERRRAEEERARLYSEAQEAIRVRDEFLSIASHELRTPITPLQLQIQAFLRGLKRAGPTAFSPEKAAEKLEVAARQLERLTKLIDELLDVARISGGKLTLERERTDLGRIATEAVARFAEQSERAGCHVVVEAAPTIGDWDPLRLDQVVVNLFTNALKYAPGKPILVKVSEEAGRATLVVTDRGMGIASENLGRIFDRFERAVSARAYGGLGLGLYITRQIVEAHAGTIRVESVHGEGTTFTVELPVVAPIERGEARASVPPTARPESTETLRTSSVEAGAGRAGTEPPAGGRRRADAMLK